MVFAPKYRGKMLVGDVAMICEGIICKTCVEMDIQVFEQDLTERISPAPRMVWRSSLGAELFPWLCGAGMGCCGKIYS
jgi:hypothetical protein